MKLLRGRRRQLEAIRTGFDIFGFRAQMVGRFNVEDLMVLLGGTAELDAETLLSNIDFGSGNWRRSRTPAHLRRLIREWDSKMLRNFVKFVTGSPCLPYGGLQNLSRSNQIGSTKTKITLTRLPKSGRLPESHTCFNNLDLPDYNDFNCLKNKLAQAMSGDDGHFDLL